MGMAMVIATCVWPPPFHMLLSSLQHVWLPLLSTLSGSKVTLMFGDIACCKRLAYVREFSAETLLSFPVLSFLEDMRDLSLRIHHSHNHLHRSCLQSNVPKAFPESGRFCILPNEWHRHTLNYLSDKEDALGLFLWAIWIPTIVQVEWQPNNFFVCSLPLTS